MEGAVANNSSNNSAGHGASSGQIKSSSQLRENNSMSMDGKNSNNQFQLNQNAFNQLSGNQQEQEFDTFEAPPSQPHKPKLEITPENLQESSNVLVVGKSEMFVELDSLPSARKNIKSQIKPLNLPIREEDSIANSVNATGERKRPNIGSGSEFNDTLTSTNKGHDFGYLYEREMQQRNVRGSTANPSIVKPMKIKWTFLDERSDFKVNNACKNLRQARKQRIQQAEDSVLQSEHPGTRDSTRYQGGSSNGVYQVRGGTAISEIRHKDENDGDLSAKIRSNFEILNDHQKHFKYGANGQIIDEISQVDDLRLYNPFNKLSDKKNIIAEANRALSGAAIMKSKNTFQMYIDSNAQGFDSDDKLTPSLDNGRKKAVVSSNLLQHASRQGEVQSKQLQMLLKRGTTPMNNSSIINNDFFDANSAYKSSSVGKLNQTAMQFMNRRRQGSQTPGFDEGFSQHINPQFNGDSFKKMEYRTKIPPDVLKRIHRKSTAQVSPNHNYSSMLSPTLSMQASTRPITQNTRLYSRENKALGRILESNHKIQSKLQIYQDSYLPQTAKNYEQSSNPRSSTAFSQPRTKTNKENLLQINLPIDHGIKSPFHNEVQSIIKNLDVSLSDISDSPSHEKGGDHFKHLLAEAKSEITDEILPVEDDIDAQIRLADEKSKLICQENPGFRMKVRESYIPLEVLYNKDVNGQKMIEKLFGSHNRPFTFDILQNYKGTEGENFAKISLLEGNREDFELQFETNQIDKAKQKQHRPSINIDVGKPMCNRILVTSKPQYGVEPTVFSPDTLSGKIPFKYQPQRRLSYVDTESDSPQQLQLSQLQVYSHQQKIKQEMKKHIVIKTMNIPFDELKHEVTKYKEMVTFKEEREIVINNNEVTLNSQESERKTNPTGKVVIKAKGANLPNEVGQRYTAMVDEFSKLAKKRHELLKLSQQNPELYKIKQAEFEKEVQRNIKASGLDYQPGRRLKEEDLIGKNRFNIGILKPHIQKLMSAMINEQNKGAGDVIENSVKISDEQALDRHMARSHYGKWYLPPEKFSQLEAEAHRDHNVDSHKKANSPQKNHSHHEKKKTQIDWNRQTKLLIKKSIPEKESTLSKMLNQMSTEDFLIAKRELQRDLYSSQLRGKAQFLLNPKYMDQIISMQPGTADAYFYELRKIVEYQEMQHPQTFQTENNARSESQLQSEEQLIEEVPPVAAASAVQVEDEQ